jgi:predicted dithiol-disulfide oxidoreductase (DUF899 family)
MEQRELHGCCRRIRDLSFFWSHPSIAASFIEFVIVFDRDRRTFMSYRVELKIDVTPAILFAFWRKADVNFQAAVRGIVNPPGDPGTIGTQQKQAVQWECSSVVGCVPTKSTRGKQPDAEFILDEWFNIKAEWAGRTLNFVESHNSSILPDQEGANMSIHFPNESPEYRRRRNELLNLELDLRRQLETVAALRRTLPVSSRVDQDYEFEEESGPVRLSQLFKPGHQSLIVYNFMFGPAMPTPCTSCTSILDGLNGTSPHVNDRVSFVVVARSPIQRIGELARQRGWTNLRLLSSAANTYNRDYFGEKDDGSQWPMLNVFSKRPDGVYHFYGTEVLFASPESGQDGRHVDLIWPLWNLFDLTREGRGTKWYPKLQYE